MATVYKAHQDSLARYVAIKVLPEFFAEEPGFRERFKQEAVAVANLRHPNILAVFDYGEQEGVTYIVTEFVDGGTLAEQFGKPLPVEYVTTLLQPIASALDYAHRREVLHRDIKPSNVLLQTDGTPILSDFGLARMMTSKAERLTQSGMIVGTPEYMSPEQCAGTELDAAADQYSLAVVAYEGLTGRVPFSAETPVAVIMAQIGNELPPPRSVNPEISEAVQGALLKALAKDPKDRYKSCAAFIHSLTEADQSQPTVPEATTVMPRLDPAPVAPGLVAPAPLAPASLAPATGGFRAATPGPAYSPTPAPTSYQPPAPPAFGPPAQQAWMGSPAMAAAAVTQGIPGWVTVLLILGAIAAGLWGFVVVLAFTQPPDTADNGYYGWLTLFVVASLAVLIASVIAIVGIVRGKAWARTLTIVAAVTMGLTCVGLVLAVPIGIGVVRSRR